MSNAEDRPNATTRGALAQALLGSELIDRLLDYAKTGEDRQQVAWSWANRITDWLEQADAMFPARLDAAPQAVHDAQQEGEYQAPIAPDGEPCYWCDQANGPCRIHEAAQPEGEPR